MSKINKLSDIEIYTEALKLASEIYKLTRLTGIKNDFSLVGQIRQAALSIPANIAEGYGRKSKKDFSQFLSVALGSANEVITFLDFINLEYKIATDILQERYNSLAKRVFTFRSYLIKFTTHNP